MSLPPTVATVYRITLAEWEAKGRELFGPNKDDWRMVCPLCHTEASITRARAEWPEVKGRGWSPAQECVGCYLSDEKAPKKLVRGKPSNEPCDWKAYGLFRGPVFVQPPDGGEHVPCFDFAGLPFTSPKAIA